MATKKRLVKIRTEDLRIGMFVDSLGRSWLNHPWATQKKRIGCRDDIAGLLDHGIAEVTVDLDKSDKVFRELETEHGIGPQTLDASRKLDLKDVSAKVSGATSPQKDPLPQVERRRHPRPDAKDPLAIEEEIPKARAAYSQALEATRGFLNDVKAGRKIDVARVQGNVEQMLDSIFRNRDALLALLKLKNYDEYTFTHCLNVAVLSVSLGRHLGLPREKLTDLGLGAMFHDVGKQLVPSKILNKPDRLTEEEFTVIKKHPELGTELMAAYSQLSPHALEIIRSHHERTDGTGYPDGKQDDQIGPLAAIVAICDVYDALSSDRVYHRGMSPHEALKVVFSLKGHHFSNALVDRFIQGLGIYPAGTTVRLMTREVGVVIQVNHAFLLAPTIKIFLDNKGQALPKPKTLDLADPSLVDRKISAVVDPARYGLDPAQAFESEAPAPFA